MKKVQFLRTSAGDYGILHEGDKATLNPKLAEELAEKGIVKVTGDSEDAETKPKEGSVKVSNVKADSGVSTKATAKNVKK